MNNEGPATPTNGWTVATLHTHMQALLNERDRLWMALLKQHDLRYEQRFKSSEQAILVNDQNMKEWKASANEWRGAMDDKDKLLMSRPEITSELKAITARVDAIRNLCFSAVLVIAAVVTAAVALLKN